MASIGEPATLLPARSEGMENSRTGRFVQSVVPFAQAEEREYGVPASVSIAQAILETGWGRSTLNTIGFNYFGIKCISVLSPYQDGCWNLSTSEYVNGGYVSVNAGFRTYGSVYDSFMDHGRFLRVNDRYADAFKTSTSDDFARAVAAAGYATSPSYAASVIDIMVDFDLYRYDLRSADPVTINQAVSVAGTIGNLYYSSSVYAERLGVPVGGEDTGPISGSRMVVFNKGIIVWTAAYGAQAIYGSIWDTYRRSHAARASLGAPVGSTISGGNLTELVFEQGRIDPQNGVILLNPTTPTPETPTPPTSESPAPDPKPNTPTTPPPTTPTT
ncbi:MAG: glucosaminidase domain-containing protein, partial [Propionibacteriaceae bacterium]|nr:glucosaminidase domain-containing protein [Propionibacteriaceae bacterium]